MKPPGDDKSNQLTKRGRGRPRKDPQAQHSIETASTTMDKNGNVVGKKAVEKSPTNLPKGQRAKKQTPSENFFNLEPPEMEKVRNVVGSWKSNFPLHDAFKDSVIYVLEKFSSRNPDESFHYKFYGSLVTCSYSPLKLPDLDMAFVMDFAKGEFKDLLKLQMVENGYICGLANNDDCVKEHQLKLADFWRQRIRRVKSKDECSIFKEKDGKWYLNASALRAMLMGWKDKFGLIEAKIPSSGCSLSFSFDINPRSHGKPSSVEKFMKDMRYKSQRWEVRTLQFKELGLPLWKLHEDLCIDVDLSILINVTFSSLPQEWQTWTTRTPSKFWPSEDVIKELKAAHVLLSPRCSPVDGKMDQDFCPTFDQDILLKDIPNGISTLSLLKSLLISFAEKSKDRPTVKSNTLTQVILWVQECHSVGRDIMEIFQDPIPPGTNKKPATANLQNEVMLLKCLSLLKESYKNGKRLPNFFNPKINVLDFDAKTDTFSQLGRKPVLLNQLQKIHEAKPQSCYDILTIAKIIFLTDGDLLLKSKEPLSAKRLQSFVKRHQPDWITNEEAKLDNEESSLPDQSHQLLKLIKEII
ncbi:uncharacterized protein LOC131891861 [Tigriopus californicus]|uniref:uncharacterized protein LOC131891861 n=1 Tax=Tigriopus californicus TaxID=6832 RepID=UPI0027D9E649|nr:uncharacterized protein LOC131891861 [Tigriopus californicus]|eukprot:TCALIF_12684-PA protein Name:"Protein of unknown function" AED:0.06 eAED:0.06 QI:0/0.75/0.4/1/1/1/5/325/580